MGGLLRQGSECGAFWKDYLTEEKHVLFVLGLGFDPRTCFALESILGNGGHAKIDCTLIDFTADLGQYDQALRSLVDRNRRKLCRMMDGRGRINERSIAMRADADHLASPRDAAKTFEKPSDFCGYTDVVVDISSIPMSLYFPLIGKILSALDSQKSVPLPNLHVVATENIQIDECISKRGLSDEAKYLYGFTGDVDLQSEEEKPLVWIPMLGEDKKDQIIRISDHVSPREICPVLPSPSTNPRRGDSIMLEYRDLLDRLQIETSNIIYASEQNPFETYRQIHKTIHHYRDTLKTLGKPRFVISPPVQQTRVNWGVFGGV